MHTRLQEESKKLTEAAAELRKRLPGIPDVAVVLGTGLGGFAEQFPTVVPYTEIPWLVPSTVSGHRGAFAMGAVGGKKVLAMTGRVHYYEGYTAAEVVRPVRVMAMTGVKKLWNTAKEYIYKRRVRNTKRRKKSPHSGSGERIWWECPPR